VRGSEKHKVFSVWHISMLHSVLNLNWLILKVIHVILRDKDAILIRSIFL